MQHSLSVVLPVHNAEKTLEQQIEQLLEIVPELTSQFELMIVDDASTDQTDEIASELSRRYPQVAHIRHSQRLGHDAAAASGTSRTQGDVVFVQDRPSNIRMADLQKLWNRRNAKPEQTQPQVSESHVAGSSKNREEMEANVIERLMKWGEQLRNTSAKPGQLGERALPVRRRESAESLPAAKSKSVPAPSFGSAGTISGNNATV